MTECTGNAHSRDRIVKVLDVDFEEEPVFDMGMQGRNMAALFVVIEILGKIDSF
jgi:hypothetical protein